MRIPHVVLLAAIAVVAIAFVACGDDDDTTPTAAPSPTSTTASPTGTVTATAAPSPSPTATPTQAVSRIAANFIYTTMAGDTLERIAQTFNGQPGTAKAGFPDQIRGLNPSVSWPSPPAGTDVLVPLLPTDTTSILPYASLQVRIGSSGLLGEIELQEPSTQLMDGFRGQLALRRVSLTTPGDGSGPGYVMEYWLTDRQFVKGGVIDPDALVTEQAFLVGGGSLASTVTGTSGIFQFSQDGVAYAVKALVGAGAVTAEQIAAALRVAPHNP